MLIENNIKMGIGEKCPKVLTRVLIPQAYIQCGEG
jgi:hypothetical protein